jgi:hypothetical protein
MPVTKAGLRSEESVDQGLKPGASLQFQPMRRTNHQDNGINELRGLDVAFKASNVGRKATFSFTRAIGKLTWHPPHLVSADEVMPESRPAVDSALDAELTHPVAKRVGMEIQDSRRTLRPINHPICLLKGGQDMVSLHLFQRRQS